MPYSAWAVARVAPTVAPPVAVGLVCVAPAVVAVAVAPVVPAAVATPIMLLLLTQLPLQSLHLLCQLYDRGSCIPYCFYPLTGSPHFYRRSIFPSTVSPMPLS